DIQRYENRYWHNLLFREAEMPIPFIVPVKIICGFCLHERGEKIRFNNSYINNCVYSWLLDPRYTPVYFYQNVDYRYIVMILTEIVFGIIIGIPFYFFYKNAKKLSKKETLSLSIIHIIMAILLYIIIHNNPNYYRQLSFALPLLTFWCGCFVITLVRCFYTLSIQKPLIFYISTFLSLIIPSLSAIFVFMCRKHYSFDNISQYYLNYFIIWVICSITTLWLIYHALDFIHTHLSSVFH
ncbi:hypothetical protein, partial [Sharpea porci]|uniref:hypothetical protein n=1 Tax=Sharpea porci TaxID=2652286 RepID=UPI002A91A91D